jgi:hypothetical protein
MLGSAKSPMVSTVAPTAPVMGANNAPMMKLAIPMPPARRPNKLLKPSSRPAARVERSNTTPR